METLQQVFPLHQAYSPLAPPAPTQGPPSPPLLGTPQMPDSLGEAYVVVDLPDTSKVAIVTYDDEPMEDFEGHLEEEDDLEEDQEIDEVVEEQ